MIDDRTEYAQSDARGTDSGRALPSLDSVRTNCNKRLGGWFYANTETGEIVPFRCKSWRCEECGPRRARRFRHQVGVWAEKHRLNKFVTVTLDPKKMGSDPYAYLSRCWHKFGIYLARRFGKKKVSYIWMMELQRNGNPHLHILVNRYLPQKWLSRTWDAIGGGKIVDVRFVDIQRIRPYLAKYLNKAWHQMAIPAKKRRYSTSRDIRLSEAPEDGQEDEQEESRQGTWRLFAGRGWVMSRGEYDRLVESERSPP